MRFVHTVTMDLRELDWFATLAEHPHVTDAAGQLNISQPTLSRGVARLERRLGVPLFDRQQNRLRLNRYGEVFRAHVLRAIAEISTAEERIAALIDPDEGTVALGFLHSFGGWLVPQLLSTYQAVVPAVTFQLRGCPADVVVDELRKGRLDVGLTSPQPAGDDVHWVPLLDERLMVAVPATHRFADRSAVEPDELADEGFVVFPPVFGTRQLGDRICAEAGFGPKVVAEGTELTTVRALVGAGIGVAIIPETRGPTDLGADWVEIPITGDNARRTIGMITPGDRSIAPVARRFCSHIVDAFDASTALSG